MTDPTPLTTSAPLLIVLEEALWTPGNEWRLAVEHVASRFRRVAGLDVDATLAAGTFAEQVAALEAWAARAATTSIDVDGELARYFDQHLSMHLRPVPGQTRALRAGASRGELHCCSALPAAAASSIAHHAGMLRSLASMHGSVQSAAQQEQLRERVGASRLITSLAQLDETPA